MQRELVEYVFYLRSTILQWPSILCLVVGLALLINLYPLITRPPLTFGAPPMVMPSWPLAGSVRFFTDRARFCLEGKSRSKTGNFSFYFGRYPIVQMAGQEGRKTFFENKGLHLSYGYMALLNGRPPLPKGSAPPSGGKSDFPAFFARKLTRLMREDMMIRLLPFIQKDAEYCLDDLINRCQKTSGIINPFDECYRIVFRISIRTVGAMEIADSPETFDEFIASLKDMADTASPFAVIFPSVPIPAQIKNVKSGLKLYKIISSIRENRIKTGKREDDALQMLMDDGADTNMILKFILGSLFAAVLNTVLATSSILVYLATNPEWYEKAQKEVDQAVAHNRLTGETSVQAIRKLTFNSLVHHFPVLDACIKETIRFSMPTAGFRLNVSGQDIRIGETGEIIPANAYATYLFDEAHFDPSVYHEPSKWDPSRYIDGDLRRYGESIYLGWGSGAHPCMGMKFAQMEVTLIVILFMAAFEFEAIDPQGSKIAKQPRANRAGVLPGTDKDIRLRYWLRDDLARIM